MIERPILFSGPMVRAILDGTKTQTRRVVKLPIEYDGRWVGKWKIVHKAVTVAMETFNRLRGRSLSTDVAICPYGQPGDRLWVRETWGAHDQGFDTVEESTFVVYRADNDRPEPKRWRPSIHMPRWASRILLEITDVRVQRVQEISSGDARAEGCRYGLSSYEDPDYAEVHEAANALGRSPVVARFSLLWDSINAKRGHSWESNPWVWALTFRRAQP